MRIGLIGNGVAGIITPDGPGVEDICEEDSERGIHKKVLLQDGALAGAIWMGTKQGAAEVGQAAAKKFSLAKGEASLLEDDFDFGLP